MAEKVKGRTTALDCCLLVILQRLMNNDSVMTCLKLRGGGCMRSRPVPDTDTLADVTITIETSSAAVEGAAEGSDPLAFAVEQDVQPTPRQESSFEHVQGLRTWLQEYTIDVSAWGIGSAKSVEDLHAEISQGKCKVGIEEGRVIRHVSAASMRISRPGSDQYLVESKQVRNGNEWYCDKIPSEQMTRDEHAVAAAIRGVKQELGDTLMTKARSLGILHETCTVRDSASYPGLRTHFTSYEVGVEVEGLPETSFTTSEVDATYTAATPTSESKQTIIEHFWSWRKQLAQLKRGCALVPSQMRLVDRLFAGCSKVTIAPLHGGLSGSLVLKADSFQADSYKGDGSREEPTVLKLDTEKEMRREVEQMRYVHSLISDGVVSIKREPEYLDGYGALLIETAGACWVMPEFYGKLDDVNLIRTFKRMLIEMLTAPDEAHVMAQFDACCAVVRELWWSGGPLSKLSLTTASRHQTKALEVGGLVEETLRDLGERMALLFVAPDQTSTRFALPKLMDAVGKLKLKLDPKKHAKKFGESFVHDEALTEHDLWSDAACEPLVELLRKLHALSSSTSTTMPRCTWLAEWRPLLAYQHNDLNPANVLVDVQGMAWLIDFARSTVKNPWTDTAQMIARLLFQVHPIPLSLEDLRVALSQSRKTKANLLKDTLELKEESIKLLQDVLGDGCPNAAALAESIRTLGDAEGGGELRRILIPLLATAANTSDEQIRVMCAAVDTLLGISDTQPAPSALRVMAARKPKESWPQALRLVFELCTTSLGLTRQVLRKCQQQQMQAEDGSDAADAEHPAAFLIALLKCTLEFLRYPQLSSGQKRVVWHATLRLAAALSKALDGAPEAVDDSAISDLPSALKLERGRPVLLKGNNARVPQVDTGLLQPEEVFVFAKSSIPQVEFDTLHPKHHMVVTSDSSPSFSPADMRSLSEQLMVADTSLRQRGLCTQGGWQLTNDLLQLIEGHRKMLRELMTLDQALRTVLFSKRKPRQKQAPEILQNAAQLLLDVREDVNLRSIDELAKAAHAASIEAKFVKLITQGKVSSLPAERVVTGRAQV